MAERTLRPDGWCAGCLTPAVACYVGGGRGMLCAACERELFAAGRQRVLDEQLRPTAPAEEVFGELLAEVTCP